MWTENNEEEGSAVNGESEKDVKQRLDELEKAQAVEAATNAGAHATQAAAHAGTWAAVAAGAAGLVVGMLLGALFSND
jgi:ElaB/YqjD/DUF883 family membrane-anchored ribosome-binding protein